MATPTDKKQKYLERTMKLFSEYNRMLVVSVDNVGSKHFQAIRMSLRPSSHILMGKNTLIRRALNLLIKEKGRDDLKALLPYVRNNVGLIFTKESLSVVKRKVESNRVPAAAKVGSVALNDVELKAGPTGMEPTKTSFLQAVGISSKIVKGQVEIIGDNMLVREGERVSASVAVLLDILKIKPFTYGMRARGAFENGAVFEPAVLDLSDEDLMTKFRSGLANVASLSLAVGYPTVASVPHSFINGFKNVAALSLATDYTFPQVQKLKDLLADPEKLAALAAAASAAAPAAGAAAAAAAPAAKEEAPEEEVNFSGGGLFGGDGEDEW